jgi:flagellar basal-body rod protein FlgG
MPKGIYAAASAMVVETRNQEAVAHNLANLQTAGYRNETALRTSFAALMAQRGSGGDLSGEGGAGVLNAGSYYSFTQGTLETTGAPLDLALTGDGFYRVRTDQGRELLTRAAHFNTDPQGRLVTPEGWTVEGQGGVITIPPDAGHVMVGKTGTISVSSNANGVSADTVLDQLRIVKVAKPGSMTAVNGQYFDPGDQAQTDATLSTGAIGSSGTTVQQGMIERSNVDSLQQLASMIAGERRYDSAQRAFREQYKVGASLTDLLRGVS